jgi:acetylornithine deacetylase/succinyl-diaminopimelate desuccinylase-like protein
MSARAGAADGARHLAVLAREPRPAGSDAEERARRYAEAVLERAGFAIAREPFSYSTFPGRFATPIGGAIAAATVLVATAIGLTRPVGSGPLAALVIGLLVLGAFARSMLGDAVLALPLLRANAVNVVATRRGDAPRVWLVAHLDSKSQPVPTLLRVAGVMMLVSALLLATVAAVLQLASLPNRMVWWLAALDALVGAVPVLASVVGARSAGALDNASGVASVLAAAEMLEPGAAVGILLPSAEELGLAGARAWARERPAGVALNCDGVDDHGELTIMHGSNPPDEIIEVVSRVASSAPHVRRMPLGLLTDSVALADRGWRTVTLSRGSLTSLRRVHTPDDSLATLRGTGVSEMATVLARAAEALA